MEQREKSVKTVGEYWQESQLVFSKIYKYGVRDYVDSLPSSVLRMAFNLHDRSLRCIDEGTPGGIHVAGSGILLSVEEKQVELTKVMSELRTAGVDGVYSHKGCGAARLYAETVKGQPDKSDEYAVNWGQKLARDLNVPYKGHIVELSRPQEFHNARIIYYDGSGKFDPFRIKEIPDGFIISRYYLDGGYAKEELGIALSIALGHHGFGDKFTHDDPLIVSPIEGITNDTEALSLSSLIKEALDVTAQFGNRVIVQGFKQPQILPEDNQSE